MSANGLNLLASIRVIRGRKFARLGFVRKTRFCGIAAQKTANRAAPLATTKRITPFGNPPSVKSAA
jgi:hypothetical protein